MDPFLATFVDSYFYMEMDSSCLSAGGEFVFPFPRITFVHLFDKPFLVTNHSNNQSVKAQTVIARPLTDRLSAQPLCQNFKIIGAQVKPYGLAFLNKASIKAMPWLISSVDLFQEVARDFQQRIMICSSPDQMFEEVEQVFLRNLLNRDLTLIIHLVERIELLKGVISVARLADEFAVSERTIRNHFYQHIGCSPKDYIRLVKWKQLVYQMHFSDDPLVAIAYDSGFYDQAHFIHEVKDLSGRLPQKLRREIPFFRFLQF
jgi:AraC-like DNA-binding protein